MCVHSVHEKQHSKTIFEWGKPPMDSSMVGSEMALPGGFSGEITAIGASTLQKDYGFFELMLWYTFN